jgi:hypothetical protein
LKDSADCLAQDAARRWPELTSDFFENQKGI